MNLKIFLLIALFFGNLEYSISQTSKVIEVSFDKSVLIIYGTFHDQSTDVKFYNVGLEESVGVISKENKITLQALEEGFPETNLFVELMNGAIYSYVIKYNNDTNFLVYQEPVVSHHIDRDVNGAKINPKYVSSDSVVHNVVKGDISKINHLKGESSKTSTKEKIADSIKIINQVKDYITNSGEIKYRMVVWCGGIFVNDYNEYLFKVSIRNNSNISYKIGVIDILIKNVKKAFRKVVRSETRLEQLNDNSDVVVSSDSTTTFFIKTKQIAFDNNKKCVISIWENYPGERSFELELTKDHLLNVRKI